MQFVRSNINKWKTIWILGDLWRSSSRSSLSFCLHHRAKTLYSSPFNAEKCVYLIRTYLCNFPFFFFFFFCSRPDSRLSWQKFFFYFLPWRTAISRLFASCPQTPRPYHFQRIKTFDMNCCNYCKDRPRERESKTDERRRERRRKKRERWEVGGGNR